MNCYNELLEIEEIRDKINEMTDKVLDYYNNNPQDCKNLLLELNSIKEEINFLETQFKSFDM
jgi:hypothetical protein